MIGGDSLEPSRLRTLVVIVVAVGCLWLLWQAMSPAQTRMSNWRGNATSALSGQAAPLTGRGAPDADIPAGNPLRSPRTIMTQTYGVGTHAPANVWGAIDLAIDGDGDGNADPQGTYGTPIYATHRGTVKMTPNSQPAGNHIWVLGDQYKTGYAHLQGYAPGLVDGQVVERGDLIGYVGSTGLSSGPHLDYQVWKDGVNQNPLDYGALDGIN